MYSPVDDEHSEHDTLDDHRAVILGYELLWFMRNAPDDALSSDIRLWLDVALKDESERALFDLPPLPPGVVVPFRKPA